MSVTESLSMFEAGGETLVGVLSSPAAKPPRDIGVVIVVGGPQYRAGSHRQFVSLARALAAEGYPVLRFDCRGMGDSSGVKIGFEESAVDIGAAIDELHRLCPTLRRSVLWGLCDGASAVLLYLDQTADRRVAGLVLLNPWVRSEATLARTHVKHYYLRRLRQREFWVKLASGGVARQAATDLLDNVRATLGHGARSRAEQTSADRPYQERMVRALSAFGGPVALMLSGNDYTAKEFVDHVETDPLWRSATMRSNVARIEFEAADHTFSSVEATRRLEESTRDWLGTVATA